MDVGNPLPLLDPDDHLQGKQALGTLCQEVLQVLRSHLIPFNLGEKV